MKKPLIGVTPLFHEKRNSLLVPSEYLDALLDAGALPVVLPLDSDGADIARLTALCDGFLFTGGHDIDPTLYGEKKSILCGALSPQRDGLEIDLFRQALAAEKPMLGICRGMQLMNVLLGGTLYQDIPRQVRRSLPHDMKPPFDRPSHTVELAEGTPLRELVSSAELEVNSLHHQGVRVPAPGLEVMATAPDGIVEAFRHQGKRFLWGVQWHPEYCWQTDENQRRLFRAFVEACQ